jgi:hypothetical protein
MSDMIHELPDGSGFFVAEIDTSPDRPQRDPIMWNPWNKVVQDHRDGTIHHEATNAARTERGLPTLWTPEIGAVEVHQAPVR